MKVVIPLLVALSIGSAAANAQNEQSSLQPSDRLPEDKLNAGAGVEAIDMIWAGHRVNNQMVIRNGHQFIPYYDATRQMAIAHRASPSSVWRYHKLPSALGWDSHNYVTVDVDEAGYIHVLGNMHADPIVYFRSTEPWNIRTLKQQEYLADKTREKRVTYPVFFRDNEGRLIVRFRIGGSGDGNYFFHRFDTKSMTWSLLHDKQFTDGEGERGSYPVGPDKGPDGLFHSIWVWRETPSAATNNNLSYARSRDMVNWEDSNGKPVALPIIRSTGEIVDPVPVGGGMLNGQTRLGFDNDKRPIIAYYKHDKKGDTQIFLARKKGAGWSLHQLSNWTDSKQDLERGGSLTVNITVPEDPFVAKDGSIRVRAIWNGKRYEFVVDAKSNKVLREQPWEQWPASVTAIRDNPNLTQYITKAKTDSSDGQMEYYLSWEAYPSFQDQPKSEIPAPVTLRLHKIPKATK
jgi:BNR repeat-containing family member